MSTVAMINNDSTNNKTKQLLKMIIELQHSANKERTSNILTKTLDPKPFTHLRTKLLGKLGVCDSHCDSTGVPIVSQ